MTGVFYMPLRQHGVGTDTEKESAREVDSGEDNSPAAPAGIRTHNLSISRVRLSNNKLSRLSGISEQTQQTIKVGSSRGYEIVTSLEVGSTTPGPYMYASRYGWIKQFEEKAGDRQTATSAKELIGCYVCSAPCF